MVKDDKQTHGECPECHGVTVAGERDNWTHRTHAKGFDVYHACSDGVERYIRTVHTGGGQA